MAELYRSIHALTYYHVAASSTLHTDATACSAAIHVASPVSSLVQQTQHAFLSTDVALQLKTSTEEYEEPGDERPITCPNCGEQVSKGSGKPRGPLTNSKQPNSISADILFDCASRFSRDKPSSSIDRLSKKFTGSPDYIFERDSSFYPEQYALEGLFSKPLFAVAMKESYAGRHLTQQYYLIYGQTPRCWQRVIVSAIFKITRDPSAIPQASAPDNIDAACKVLPNAVDIILNKLLSRIRLFESVTRLSLTLIENEDREIIQESSQVESVEDRLEVSLSQKDEILHDVEVMGLPMVPEAEVLVASQIKSTSFTVRWNEQACVERKVAFASAGRDGDNGLHDFIEDLKLLNSLRGCHGVSQLVGVVFDDSLQHLKGYLYEAPLIFSLPRVFYAASSNSFAVPWSVRELWSKQITQAIASVHQKGITIGVLGRGQVGLRADGSAILLGFETSTRYMVDDEGEVPPELRSTDGSPLHQRMSDRTDIFQLGMLFWLLAEQKNNITGSRCSRSVCTYFPRHQCTADHTNPVELPPCFNSIPTYFSDIIRWCRSPNPSARPTARKIAEILSYESDIEACPRDVLEFLNTCCGAANTFSVHCDNCGALSHYLHYHCYACQFGNFDLCQDCVAQGIHCYKPEHILVKRTVKNGSYVHSS